MMTAIRMKTGESMGRTGEDGQRSELPAGYSISAEYGLIRLHRGCVLLMALLDPVAQGTAAQPERARWMLEADLVRAACFHQEARNLVAEELDQLRMGLHESAEATSRRRLARRADYYAALEAANSRARTETPNHRGR